MRKILLILCAILTTTSANATQMCARRDTTVIPLDAAAGASAAYNDERENMWWVVFGYGNIYGIAACLSEPEIQEYVPTWSSSNGKTPPPNDLLTDTEELWGRGGTYILDGTEYDRKYCYCKLTHPMSSNWVSIATLPGTCGSTCYTYCKSAISTQYTQRVKMFPTIGYGYENIDTNEYDQSIHLN